MPDTFLTLSQFDVLNKSDNEYTARNYEFSISRINCPLSEKRGLREAKRKETPYFQQKFADFSQKYRIITAFRLSKTRTFLQW